MQLFVVIDTQLWLGPSHIITTKLHYYNYNWMEFQVVNYFLIVTHVHILSNCFPSLLSVTSCPYLSSQQKEVKGNSLRECKCEQQPRNIDCLEFYPVVIYSSAISW
jgi:hypothetical protein